MRLRHPLFPEPPRRLPAHRALSLTLRTAHLMTFGALLGGHLFDVEPSRLLPFLLATIASGVGLMALELASTCAWLFMGKGLAVLLKLMLLLLIPLFWEHRVLLLLATVAVASLASHAPARFRHRYFLPVPGQPVPVAADPAAPVRITGGAAFPRSAAGTEAMAAESAAAGGFSRSV